MFFCEKCGYLFNITKDIRGKRNEKETDVALTKIFEKFISEGKVEREDIKNIKKKDLLADERFETMNKKDQKKLMSIIRAVNKNFFDEEELKTDQSSSDNTAYFVCKFCRNYRPIKPGTIIYSKNYGFTDGNEADYSLVIYDQTLPRTRNYICKNPSCNTHDNDKIKEAVLTKNLKDQLVYVCTNCLTYWTISI
ncbi:MAG: hypothetical protein QXW79_01465 [Thermoplasmata archaeon]